MFCALARAAPLLLHAASSCTNASARLAWAAAICPLAPLASSRVSCCCLERVTRPHCASRTASCSASSCHDKTQGVTTGRQDVCMCCAFLGLLLALIKNRPFDAGAAAAARTRQAAECPCWTLEMVNVWGGQPPLLECLGGWNPTRPQQPER